MFNFSVDNYKLHFYIKDKTSFNDYFKFLYTFSNLLPKKKEQYITISVF